MIDEDAFITRMVESDPLRKPVLSSMIEDLQLPKGSRGLDAGCGVGLQTLLLAEAVGSAGHITGLDIWPAFLRYGRTMVQEQNLEDRISFKEGDVRQLPFEDDAFDWVWSADCVGFPTGDLTALMRELARVVKPGGTVAVMAWTSQNLLPGYPLLEAQLNAVYSGLEHLIRGKRPESHFMRMPGCFSEAGLEPARGKTFAATIQAPLSDDIRSAMDALFRILWREPQFDESPSDQADYRRLCNPESPECILDQSDYYAYFTYTMFRGKVPE